MKQKISVTAEDIEKGARECEFSCPIALALRREFPKTEVCVDSIDIRVGDVSVKTPETAALFISDFDCGDEVEPFEFEIDLNPLASLTPS